MLFLYLIKIELYYKLHYVIYIISIKTPVPCHLWETLLLVRNLLPDPGRGTYTSSWCPISKHTFKADRRGSSSCITSHSRISRISSLFYRARFFSSAPAFHRSFVYHNGFFAKFCPVRLGMATER